MKPAGEAPRAEPTDNEWADTIEGVPVNGSGTRVEVTSPDGEGPHTFAPMDCDGRCGVVSLHEQRIGHSICAICGREKTDWPRFRHQGFVKEQSVTDGE